METQTGIQALKSRLGVYLRMVKQGRTIAITERGKVIGYLSPTAPSLDEKMKALENAGFLRRGKAKLHPREPVIVNTGPRQVSDMVAEDRR